jgi:hypothetical protein
MRHSCRGTGRCDSRAEMTLVNRSVLPYVLLSAGCAALTLYACFGYVMAGMLGDPSHQNHRAATTWGIAAIASGGATVGFAFIARRRRRAARSQEK